MFALTFRKKILRIGDFEKFSFFDLVILDLLGYQGWDEILMITLVSNQKFPNNISAACVLPF